VAPLIGKLSDDQAVQVLMQMKPASAAKILGSLSPDYAARISSNMITLNEE
jgi:flagellar motility protein MotE (MotC chaperone)